MDDVAFWAAGLWRLGLVLFIVLTIGGAIWGKIRNRRRSYKQNLR